MCIIDMQGNLLGMVVHVADIDDMKSGILLPQKACEKYPLTEVFCAAAGYRGMFADEVHRKTSADILLKNKPQEWEKLP